MVRSRTLPRILMERYRLLRQIGGGGMGKVFEAEVVRTGLRVAIKMLHPLMAHDEEARTRLSRECELVQKVDHDALVPILDIDEDVSDGTPFVVMELLRGEDLRDKLDNDGAVPIRDAIWIAWHVADALSAVHASNVVHRDLKPENIFLQVQQHVAVRVRILDFGIAKARERLTNSITLTKHGRTLGTPAYMSPEQARGDRQLDASTDIYALAVVLYEMLTGQSPYPGGDDASPLYLLQIIREREPIPLRHFRPDASRSLEFLLACALEKNRHARIRSMEEFMSALSAIASEPLPGAPVTELEWGDEQRRTAQSLQFNPRATQRRAAARKTGRT